MKPAGKISFSDSIIAGSELSVIYQYNHKTRVYDFISSGITELTGYTFSEINNIGFENLVKEVSEISSDDFNIQKTEFGANEAKQFSAKYLILTKEGKESWVQDKAIRFIDSKGDNLFSVGTLKRFTESESLIEKFKYSNENIESIFDLANLLLLVIDEEGKIRLINKKACKLLGINRQNILRKGMVCHRS